MQPEASLYNSLISDTRPLLINDQVLMHQEYPVHIDVLIEIKRHSIFRCYDRLTNM